MRSRGALRGAFAAWLGLIALHAVSTRGGSGRVTEFFGDVNGLVSRVLDPDIPAIPDRRTGTATAAAPTGTAPPPPGAVAGRAPAGNGLQPGTGIPSSGVVFTSPSLQPRIPLPR
jgi:hypothetical protein